MDAPAEDSVPLFEKLIYQNDDKFYQVRLTISEFRDTHYVNIRKYFQSYEGEYVPSREGISMEASLHNLFALLDGLMEICSYAESIEVVLKHLSRFMADPKVQQANEQ